MRFSINTLGCKANLCESDEISSMLADRGFEAVDYRSGNPRLCIINTCTVTAESDRKSRQLIRKIRKTNKKAKLVVTGCYVKDNYGFCLDNGADLVIDNERKVDMSIVVGDILEEVEAEKRYGETAALYGSSIQHSRPIIKVQDGCEQNCSYCIIPRVRGPYRSVDKDTVLEKIDRLSENGFEEVVLTGIHIGRYGIDLGEDYGLSELLADIFSQTDVKRIRISSLEVNEVHNGLVSVLKDNYGRLAHHLHIPLQSGSDRILSSMGRPYDAGSFLEAVGSLEKALPGLAVTTDVMVGFPGEKDVDFDKTLRVVKKAGFSKLHVFKYSPRPGARAELMGDRVEAGIKKERSRILRKLGDTMREEFLKGNTGTVLSAAIEESDGDSDMLCGTTGNYIKVYFTAGPNTGLKKGKIVKVETVKRYRDGLAGKIA